jgi:hypothetical protein
VVLTTQTALTIHNPSPVIIAIAAKLDSRRVIAIEITIEVSHRTHRDERRRGPVPHDQEIAVTTTKDDAPVVITVISAEIFAIATNSQKIIFVAENPVVVTEPFGVELAFGLAIPAADAAFPEILKAKTAFNADIIAIITRNRLRGKSSRTDAKSTEYERG